MSFLAASINPMAKRKAAKPKKVAVKKAVAATGPAAVAPPSTPKASPTGAVGSVASTTPAPPPNHFASMFPGMPPSAVLAPDFAVPPEIVGAIEKIETHLKMPVWVLIQDGSEEPDHDSFNMIGDLVSTAFFQARHKELNKKQRVALLIDSPGGLARSAYEVAMLLRNHCGGFVAIIPRHAKSAATLLTLGADAIIMNEHAELGPLDVQIWNPDREEQMSGLDEVQALERLQAFAMRATDHMMLMLIKRTKKKVNTLAPMVTEFVTKLTQPLFENIDVVRYTQMSRLLKIGEEYGKRLLQKVYGGGAEEIAKKLVEDYPEHGFPIYPDDARRLGLKVSCVPSSIRGVMEEITQYLSGRNLVGRITS
jgi:hypothetical protein